MQEEHIGVNAIEKLDEVIAGYGAKRLFLVTGGRSFGLSGADRLIAPYIRSFETYVYGKAKENPAIDDIRDGIKRYAEFNPDLVIAVGGGSAIDTAKAINLLSAQNGDPEEYVIGRTDPTRKGVPLVAIPTTAGSGSEATRFATVYIAKRKYSLAHDMVLPDVAIVDPRLTASMPPHLSASTGLDALCQSIESFWSIHSTEESRRYSREALLLIVPNVRVVVRSPTLAGRECMARAAFLAGKAINIAKTTAPHALSYALTAFFGVSHGHAAALTLGSFLEFNSQVTVDDICDVRGVDHVKGCIREIVTMLGCADPADAKRMLRQLITDVGLENSFSALRIGVETAVKTITDNVNAERLENNPRRIPEYALAALLEELR